MEESIISVGSVVVKFILESGTDQLREWIYTSDWVLFILRDSVEVRKRYWNNRASASEKLGKQYSKRDDTKTEQEIVKETVHKERWYKNNVKVSEWKSIGESEVLKIHQAVIGCMRQARLCETARSDRARSDRANRRQRSTADSGTLFRYKNVYDVWEWKWI